MMDSLIVHNEKIIPLAEACLSPGQAGLLLGWGAFTTLRLYAGIPFEFPRHWERMAHDAARLNMELPLNPAAARKWVIDLALANERREGMARVSFIRNSGGAWSAWDKARPMDFLVFTQALPSWPASYSLQLQPNAVFSAGVYAGAKMLSWASNSTLMERARADGYDDALLLNEHGHVVECTSANIFVVRSGRIFTPPLSSGCLPGITREVILGLGAEAGAPITEKEITSSDLDAAEEVFLSSTTREVGGVRSIGERWQYEAPGKITQALAAAFQQYAQSKLKSARTEDEGFL
ncbi:MAG TPA: aminotransferase class IV [Terriglobia bacterium]|nr:aminotransferase class IV [Terriglobia bacterium]